MTRILVFDEYPSMREILAEELAADGSTVVLLGKTDLILKEISIFRPDLMVLDLFLRGKWRWDLFEEIKARNPDLPILIFSGCSPRGDPHLLQTEGFVMKSSVFDELRENILKIRMHSRLALNM